MRKVAHRTWTGLPLWKRSRIAIFDNLLNAGVYVFSIGCDPPYATSSKILRGNLANAELGIPVLILFTFEKVLSLYGAISSRQFNVSKSIKK